MLNCRPDQTPLRILGEKLTADPSRVVLRPFHLAWQSSVSEPSRSAQLVQDLLRLDEDQAELELGLVWKDFSERSEEHTSELPSLMRISYAVFCLKKKTKILT